VKIAIDVFGGDHAPDAVLDGAETALKKYDDITLFLCGNKETIEALAEKRQMPSARISIVDAPEIIGTAEHPVQAVKRKKNSSLVKALNLVAEGEADCLVSAGNTGAILAGATLLVRRLPGVKRPALAPMLPARTGGVLLTDSGANVDCKPFWLQQFAVMGAVYMQAVMGIKEPRVALLNNGAEAEKGNELTKQAYPLLEQTPIHFVGNCEARDILSGQYDVVVCDGFNGNMVLKCTEGVAMELLNILKKELMSGMRTKLGAALAKPAFRALKHKLDYTEHGGAPLLGVKGGVIKAHGSSNAKAFASAIKQAEDLVLGDVTGKIAEAMASLPAED